MVLVDIAEASAASVVGTDLLANAPPNVARAPGARRVNRIGLVGSTNPGDAAIDLFYGADFVGRFFNTTGGANVVPVDAKDMQDVSNGDMFLKPNEDLKVVIQDAGVTNVVRIKLDIEELDIDPLIAMQA